MRLEDWIIDKGVVTGESEFMFYEDGYSLIVKVWHDLGEWGIEEAFIVGESGLPCRDNAGMARQLLDGYKSYIMESIARKLQ